MRSHVASTVRGLPHRGDVAREEVHLSQPERQFLQHVPTKPSSGTRSLFIFSCPLMEGDGAVAGLKHIFIV